MCTVHHALHAAIQFPPVSRPNPKSVLLLTDSTHSDSAPVFLTHRPQPPKITPNSHGYRGRVIERVKNWKLKTLEMTTKKNPQIWWMESLTLTRIPHIGSSRYTSSRTIRFFFAGGWPWQRLRQSERGGRERECVRDMESDGSGPAGCSPGSIVWVRRRNGSWWPGKILGPEELAASHLTSPRSGTPVKLLGREDASVCVSLSLSPSLHPGRV